MLHRSGFGLLHQLLIAKHQQMCSHKPRTTETACCKSSLHRAASSPLCSAQMEGFGKKRYEGEEKILNLHGWESSSTSALFPFSALRVCLCLPRATKLLFPCPAPYSIFFLEIITTSARCRAGLQIRACLPLSLWQSQREPCSCAGCSPTGSPLVNGGRGLGGNPQHRSLKAKDAGQGRGYPCA